MHRICEHVVRWQLGIKIADGIHQIILKKKKDYSGLSGWVQKNQNQRNRNV